MTCGCPHDSKDTAEAAPSETAYIGLGSNLGDREKNIRLALQAMERTGGIRLVRSASLYDTDPEGVREQPRFLNTAARIETTLPPRELLSAVKDIEKDLGRLPGERWGPRAIDLDILLYGERIISSESLTVPHPLMGERTFVLKPLAEMEPQLVHPVLKKTVRELLEEKTGGSSAGRGDGARPYSHER